jgi:hypothetical protein
LNILITDITTQGNPIHNSHFNANPGYRNFHATNNLCLNKVGTNSTAFFPSRHLFYRNPSGVCSNIILKITLVGSSNSCSTSVKTNSSNYYLLSFDIYWLLRINTPTSTVLFKHNVQARDNLQHFSFLFKPQNNAAQASSQLFS